jgi:hypothetical protein
MASIEAANNIEYIIAKFKSYKATHPNLARIWLSYLELKKRHHDTNDLLQSTVVLDKLQEGYEDIEREDIIRFLIFMRINNE